MNELSKNSVEETKTYLQLDNLSSAQQEALLERVTTSNPHCSSCLTHSDLARFSWNGSVLGPLELDQGRAATLGVRSRYFNDLAPLHFNSATLGIPSVNAARAAWVIAKRLSQLIKQGDLALTEKIISAVSLRCFQELCAYYDIAPESSECLFSDNSSLALFQFISALNLPRESVMVSFFDTGKTLPAALEGKDPLGQSGNFKPMIDIWSYRSSPAQQVVDIGPYAVKLIHHFTSRHKTDAELTDELLIYVRDTAVSMVVIPTISSSGRVLPFRDMCSAIRSLRKAHAPIIILDDSQGIGRLGMEQYGTQNTLERCDGILLTGGKVLGALLGTGALILRRGLFPIVKKLSKTYNSFALPRYGLASTDTGRVTAFNLMSSEIALTPEIASLAIALQETPRDSTRCNTVDSLHENIVTTLRRYPQVQLLVDATPTVRFEKSIIAFYFSESSHLGLALKKALMTPDSGYSTWGEYPVSLAAIITADGREYVRLALDPAQALLDADYSRKLNEALRRIGAFLEAL